MQPLALIRTFKSTLKRALKGESHDYTEGDIAEAVILLAVPMILELSLESVFAVVDMFFVSGLGPNAIATVGLTESVATLIYSVAGGVSTAAAAIVARRIGEKNPDAASRAGSQAIVGAIALSIIMGLGGYFGAESVLRLMGASPEVVRDGTAFAQILLGGSIVIMLLFLINGIFRGAGDAAMAMRSLWVASGTNILLCPLLIHAYGLKGAAIATVVGRGTGVLYQLYQLVRGSGVIRLKLKDLGFDPEVMRSLLTIGWPASFQYIVGSGSWIILTRLVAEIGGTAASAGYQIAFRVFVFFILPAWGLSNAAATLVGQNLGAKHHERAERSVIIAAQYSSMLMGFVTLSLVLFAGSIVGLFTQDPSVLGHGTQALRIIGSGFIFYAASMVLSQALNGAGDTKTPTRMNILCFWIFQTPFAYFLAKHTSLQAAGAMAAIPVSQALLAGLAWIYFKRGHWKTIQV